MGARHQGRIIAFQTLYRYDYTHETIEQLLDFSWLDENIINKMPPGCMDFAKTLIEGTLGNIENIDSIIKKRLEHWDFSRLSKVDLANLRISVYSLIYQTDIPHSVTIDEAIDIAKQFSTEDSYRFINGVLDSINKSIE